MELWYSDPHTKTVRLQMMVEEHLVCEQTEFQRIDILQTTEFGKVLVLDGELMITQKDEFIYHEMISHVPMAVHPAIKSVLVLGAGDGGTIRELVKYDTTERIDLVLLDRMVIELCRRYFPETACGLDDPRVNIFHDEELRFVRGKVNEYDLIIVDCADPYGPAEGMFTREFYGTCYKALKDDGILINQHESPFYSEHSKTVQKAHRHITKVFPYSTVYQCHIPSYPSGHWLFGFASKRYDPVYDLDELKWNSLGIRTRYYNTDLHKGSFYLPTYVRDLLYT